MVTKIESIFAFVAEDSENEEKEGILAYQVNPQLLMPLVASDWQGVAHLTPYAKLISNRIGKKVKLVHFTTRIEIDEI